jgi:hypothetical protein
LYFFPIKQAMIEKQYINGRNVWIQVDAQPVERDNPRIIPTEYFTARYYFDEPVADERGTVIRDDDGGAQLFESPVAALTAARRELEKREG